MIFNNLQDLIGFHAFWLDQLYIYYIKLYFKMSITQAKGQTQKEYFRQLITNRANPESNNNVEILSLINKSILKVEGQLKNGEINIDQKVSYLDELKKLKREKHSKEVDKINKEILANQQLYRQAKRELIVQRKEENELIREEDEQKKRQILEKVRKWNELQKDLKERRQLLEASRLKKITEEEERLKRQEEEQSNFQKLEKKKIIEQKIKKIEENKVKRDQISKNAANVYQTLHPKYLEMQKKFKQLEEEMKFEEDIIKKNKKLLMKMNYETLKEHEKAYITKVEERKAERDVHSPNSADGSRVAAFDKFYNRDEEKFEQQKKKLKRRLQFQEKIKEIPITIDEAKKVKVQIAIDKSKHPLKYNFLGQKALNEFQIYGEFKDFDININPKQVGKEYLKELPTLNQNSRVQKSSSVTILTQKSKEKIKYKDYLQELKESRPEKDKDQITQIIKSHKQKSKVIEELSEKSRQYENEAKRKINELQRYNGFKSSLKKSKEVDEMYLKSIRAKLACLEMKQ